MDSKTWASVVRSLEDLIIRYGLFKLLAWLAAFAAVLLGLGVVVDRETAFRFAAFIAVGFLLLSTVAFYIDRRRLYRERAEGRQILDRYGLDLIQRQNAASFHIKEWREEQHVGKRGTTTIHRWFTLVVGDRPLDMFWHIAQMDTDRNDQDYRKKFRFEARVVGAQGDLGVRLLTTTKWTQHSIRAFIFLDRVYERGEEVRVHLHYEWPEFLKTLIDQQLVEPTEWTFRRRVELIHVTMSFDEKIGINHGFAITPYANTPQPRQFAGANRCHTIEFSWADPPQNTPVGFLVERR